MIIIYPRQNQHRPPGRGSFNFITVSIVSFLISPISLSSCHHFHSSLFLLSLFFYLFSLSLYCAFSLHSLPSFSFLFFLLFNFTIFFISFFSSFSLFPSFLILYVWKLYVHIIRLLLKIYAKCIYVSAFVLNMKLTNNSLQNFLIIYCSKLFDKLHMLSQKVENAEQSMKICD